MKKPNYTVVPNEVMDQHMTSMTGAELKVLLVIIRDTYGWHRDTKPISLSDMAKKTGLSSGTCSDAVAALVAKRLINKCRKSLDDGGHAASVYEPAFDATPSSVEREGSSPDREGPPRPVEEYKEERKQELNIKEREKKEPVTREVFLHRWKRFSSKLQRVNKALAVDVERKFTCSLTEAELAAALRGYLASDWGRENKYPVFGFLKNPLSWIQDDAGEVSEPSPIPTGRTTPPIDPEAPQRVSEVYALQEPPVVQYWNRIRKRDVKWSEFLPHEKKAMQESMQRFTEEKWGPVFEKAEIMAAGGFDPSFFWTVAKGWRAIQDGDYDRKQKAASMTQGVLDKIRRGERV